MGIDEREWYRELEIDYENGGLRSKRKKESSENRFFFTPSVGWYDLNAFDQVTMRMYLESCRYYHHDKRKHRIAFFQTRWYELHKGRWWKETALWLGYRWWVKPAFIVLATVIIYMHYLMFTAL